MKLTRKKAVELCIELWTWLAKTGKKKENWPKWEKYKYRVYNKPITSATCNDCWFCEYAYQRRKRGSKCDYCPYYKKYGFCFEDNSYYDHWENARTPRTHKKYAKLFLEQIKTLRT